MFEKMQKIRMSAKSYVSPHMLQIGMLALGVASIVSWLALPGTDFLKGLLYGISIAANLIVVWQMHHKGGN